MVTLLVLLLQHAVSLTCRSSCQGMAEAVKWSCRMLYIRRGSLIFVTFYRLPVAVCSPHRYQLGCPQVLEASMEQETIPMPGSTLLLLIPIYAILGPISLAPAVIGILVQLIVNVLHVYNDTLDRCAKLQHEQEHERQVLRMAEVVQGLSTQYESSVATLEHKLATRYETCVADLKGELNKQNVELETLKQKAGTWEQTERRLLARTAELDEEVKELLALEVARLELRIENDKEMISSPAPSVSTSVSTPTRKQISPTPRPVSRPITLYRQYLPDELKTLDPFGYFTCVGRSKTYANLPNGDKPRCGWRANNFSLEDKTEASRILTKMRSSDPGDTFETQSLRLLADCLLCPNRHREGSTNSQHPETVDRWYTHLAAAREALATAKEEAEEEERRCESAESAKAAFHSTPRFDGASSNTSSPASGPSTAATTPGDESSSTSHFNLRAATASPPQFNFGPTTSFGF